MLEKGFKILNRFEIQFQIDSESSIKQSYRAKDQKGKMFQLDIFNLASFASSFFDEDGHLIQFNLMKSLQHPNIIRYIDNGEVIIDKQKYAYCIYDFISGETLFERMKREGTLSPYTAVPIVCELLGAIEYLHDQPEPIIHNGISHNSIRLDYSEKRDKPILTNFEQARTIYHDNDSILSKFFSVFHVAPELFNGIFIPQSDLYSVGAILYHMIFGIPPYYNEQIISQPLNKFKALIQEERRKPLHFELAEEYLVDDQLKNILRKALSIDVENRFQTASEFLSALNRETSLEINESSSSPTAIEKKKIKQAGTGFDQIAGMDELKQQLKENVIDFLNNPALYQEYGIPMLNGMLLYGPPGCGKTFIAQKFAEEVGYNFVMIKPSDLQSKYVNATQENIGKLFKEAEENAPTIIFIDELDAIVPTREGELHHMHASAVNEILAQMTNCGEKNIFVIGATNRPEKIDPAVLRTGRLDKTIYLPPPEKKAREAMFKLYLKNRPIDLGLDYDKLASLTENFVSSDLKFLIDEASRKALKARSRITMGIFEQVIKENKPSVTLSELKRYQKLQQDWDDARQNEDTKTVRQPIGFKSNNKK